MEYQMKKMQQNEAGGGGSALHKKKEMKKEVLVHNIQGFNTLQNHYLQFRSLIRKGTFTQP